MAQSHTLTLMTAQTLRRVAAAEERRRERDVLRSVVERDYLDGLLEEPQAWPH